MMESTFIVTVLGLVLATGVIGTADQLPLEACRTCCDIFEYGSSFQIGCRTVGCLIGTEGSCPSGDSLANVGCRVGQNFIATGESELEGKQYFCEYSDSYGAALFDTEVANTIDECSSCCTQTEAALLNFDTDACFSGCKNSECLEDIFCSVGKEYIVQGTTNLLEEKDASCEAGILALINKITESPTNRPTEMPTNNPTNNPTSSPSISPTTNPTVHPTRFPTSSPTNTPTPSPILVPTTKPTSQPPPSTSDDNKTTSPSESHNSTKPPTTDRESANSFDLTNTGAGFTATIIGLVAGLIVSAGLCVFFLSTSSSQKRYVTRTPLPPISEKNSQLYVSQEGPLIFT